MKKRTLQNCISMEKMRIKSNVKKYKSVFQCEVSDSEENKLEKVRELIIPDAVPSTSAGRLGIFQQLQLLMNGQKQLLGEIKKVKERLEKVEENQKNILSNQSLLSIGQATLVTNQQNIADSLERIESSDISKAEFMAQTRIIMEAKVSIKKVEESVCGMTGETTDTNLEQIAAMLPLNTVAGIKVVEDKLKLPDFATSMKTYLIKTRGVSQDVGPVIRHLFTDDLMDKYNWEGRFEKLCLGQLVLFDNILRDVFPQLGSGEFEKNIRKAVERSHHRIKQKAYAKKLNKK